MHRRRADEQSDKIGVAESEKSEFGGKEWQEKL
jgi:hypothetical protein